MSKDFLFLAVKNIKSAIKLFFTREKTTMSLNNYQKIDFSAAAEKIWKKNSGKKLYNFLKTVIFSLKDHVEVSKT